MTKYGESKSMKRSKAPKTWGIPRKEKTWTIKPKPGPHSGTTSIPLLFILRDYLGYAKTRKEAKMILNNGLVLVDGKTIKEERIPLGVMDIVEIPKTEEYYRILPNRKGELYPYGIKKKEKDLKLFNIAGKQILKGGSIQLNLHDGTNILADNTYNVHDTVLYDLSKKKIKEHVPFKKGVLGLAIDGNNVSKTGKIVEIEVEEGKETTVILQSEHEKFKTLRDYVYVVGKKSPLISLPEEI